ncbi:uncharacterized protein LACBIDRAFT_331856 [Laccaria bicolor S238N-H82]|uniref:Predicted protein n=1 Tax=Laccaria bicolor (strain S238N-H82 / ATCC MYA-4686) TaxID=486041 RepID=B0DQS5_LACBS|nr:uncharacterized protein LACBIDRAFT_331856 [Laccaria bicolor S238N-H82]EDR03084.1 predicted protein [Laccaria bicolor S238N-H82]|eukprot:XP_001886225.1 predicted protein [Laccaria bicolor S238N-H82]
MDKALNPARRSSHTSPVIEIAAILLKKSIWICSSTRFDAFKAYDQHNTPTQDSAGSIKEEVKGNINAVEQRILSTADQLHALEQALAGWVPNSAEKNQGVQVYKTQACLFIWADIDDPPSSTLAKECTNLTELKKQSLIRKIAVHEEDKGKIANIFERINRDREQLVQLLRRAVCTPGTRVDISAKIATWANDDPPKSQSVFWLYGQAGSGKSTIAYIIARRLEFTSDADDTIVLLTSNRGDERPAPSFAPSWKRPQSADPSKSLHFLRRSRRDSGSEFLRELIDGTNKHHLRGLKFFATSRPDPKLVYRVESFEGKQLYRLEQVSIEEAEADIKTYSNACTFLIPLASPVSKAALRSHVGNGSGTKVTFSLFHFGTFNGKAWASGNSWQWTPWIPRRFLWLAPSSHCVHIPFIYLSTSPTRWSLFSLAALLAVLIADVTALPTPQEGSTDLVLERRAATRPKVAKGKAAGSKASTKVPGKMTAGSFKKSSSTYRNAAMQGKNPLFTVKSGRITKNKPPKTMPKGKDAGACLPYFRGANYEACLSEGRALPNVGSASVLPIHAFERSSPSRTLAAALKLIKDRINSPKNMAFLDPATNKACFALPSAQRNLEIMFIVSTPAVTVILLGTRKRPRSHENDENIPPTTPVNAKPMKFIDCSAPKKPRLSAKNGRHFTPQDIQNMRESYAQQAPTRVMKEKEQQAAAAARGAEIEAGQATDRVEQAWSLLRPLFPSMHDFLRKLLTTRHPVRSSQVSNLLTFHGHDLLNLIRDRHPSVANDWALSTARQLVSSECDSLSQRFKPAPGTSVSDILHRFSLREVLSDAEILAPTLFQILQQACGMLSTSQDQPSRKHPDLVLATTLLPRHRSNYRLPTYPKKKHPLPQILHRDYSEATGFESIVQTAMQSTILKNNGIKGVNVAKEHNKVLKANGVKRREYSDVDLD